MRPNPKKSESLEIRIPYEAKEAFMARCRRDGRSASETLRAFIDGQIAPAPRRAHGRLKVGLALVAAAAVAAGAAPALAGALLHGDGGAARTAAAFERLDADHDGKLSLAEYREGQTR